MKDLPVHSDSVLVHQSIPQKTAVRWVMFRLSVRLSDLTCDHPTRHLPAKETAEPADTEVADFWLASTHVIKQVTPCVSGHHNRAAEQASQLRPAFIPSMS